VQRGGAFGGWRLTCLQHLRSCLAAMKAHQYIIRNVSPRLDRALRAKAAARGVSLNTLVVQALEAEARVGAEPKIYHDLDDLFGTWVRDKAVDRALAEQRRGDSKDWA
jgi:HicB family